MTSPNVNTGLNAKPISPIQKWVGFFLFLEMRKSFYIVPGWPKLKITGYYVRITYEDNCMAKLHLKVGCPIICYEHFLDKQQLKLRAHAIAFLEQMKDKYEIMDKEIAFLEILSIESEYV